MKKLSNHKTIGTIDFETDPFEYNRIPRPFAAGCYTDHTYQDWWGDDCAADLARYLSDIDATFYAHNGGRFDFHYLIDYAEPQTLKIINGRIARMKIGKATLIDSFLLMPFPLDQYNKTVIDYTRFEASHREKYRGEILAYLYDDCVNLYNLVTGFHDVVGNHLTIGGAAFANMQAMGYELPETDIAHDNLFRPYYFGGRTQAFKKGYHRSVDLDYIDINSAYSWAMRFNHPVGTEYTLRRTIPKNGFYFIAFEGRSMGMLPYRNEDKIYYDDRTGGWLTTSWEFEAGLETSTIRCDKILEVWQPKNTLDFADFVDKFYGLRQQADNAGDKVSKLAYKYMLNAPYGKLAMNPADFRDYQLTDYDDAPYEPWEFEGDVGFHRELSIWSIPSRIPARYYDVATAASITGLVRAHLWRTICQGDPWYCDTDSIIGAGYDKLIGTNALGEWKSEGHISSIAIAGRKLYAAKIGNEWITASKGAILGEREIIDIAKGHSVLYQQPAPVFGLTGVSFIERNIQST